MTLSELARIAARHCTNMADAMIRACVAKALETGEPFVVPERRRAQRPAQPGRHGTAAAFDELDYEDWRRLCEGNTDTRSQHV